MSIGMNGYEGIRVTIESHFIQSHHRSSNRLNVADIESILSCSWF